MLTRIKLPKRTRYYEANALAKGIPSFLFLQCLITWRDLLADINKVRKMHAMYFRKKACKLTSPRSLSKPRIACYAAITKATFCSHKQSTRQQTYASNWTIEHTSRYASWKAPTCSFNVSFIHSLRIEPLQGSLLGGAPNPNTTK